MHDSSGCAPPENDHHQHDDEEEKYIYRTAHKLASKIEQEMESYSQIVDPVREQALSKFDRDEITLGRLLGSGGFNDVYALNQISLSSKFHRQCSEDQQRKRKVMARKSKGGKNYAIKLLRSSSCLGSNEGYCNGAADLVVETKILANIEPHRNIIQLHGVSAAGIAGFAKRVEGGYFIIIDQLHDTLDKRIETWRANKTNFTERLLVALELSSALKHLHSYNIIFRDLKPDNIGFDRCDVVKLFDFGLAKELRPSLKSKLGRQQGRQKQEEKSLHLDQHTTTANKNNDISDCKCTYQLTGKTGSRRYMAPEVALERPYNQSVDVYSFGILLWEICSLEKPFMGYSALRHEKAIVCGNERPSIATWWPVPLQWLMKRCWSNKHLERPNFKQILCTLSEVMKLCKHHSAHESTALHVKESLYFSSKPRLYKKSFAPRPTTKVRPCRSDESSSYSSPQAASYHTRAGLIAEGDKLSKLRLAAKLNDDNSFEPTETQSIESVQEEDKKSQSSKSPKVCRTSTSKRMMQPSSTTYNPKQSHDEQNKGGLLSFWK